MEMSSKGNGKGRSSEAARGRKTRGWARRGDEAMAEEKRCERCNAIGSRGSRWFGEGCLCQFQHGQKDEDALGDLGAGRSGFWWRSRSGFFAGLALELG